MVLNAPSLTEAMTGAQLISQDNRKQFANDPLNLMAADGPSNMAKSDKDAATWLPPNKASRCEYAADRETVPCPSFQRRAVVDACTTQRIPQPTIEPKRPRSALL